MILHHAGIPFQDVRVSLYSRRSYDIHIFQIPAKQWLNQKASFPFGQVPVLEVDGISIPQTEAILRYVGLLANLYPSDAYEALVVDSVVSSIVGDAFDILVKWMRATKHERDDVTAELSRFLTLMEAYVESVADDAFLVGELTIADFVLFQFCHALKSGTPPFYKNGIPNFSTIYPTIERICSSVQSLPKTREYLARTTLSNPKSSKSKSKSHHSKHSPASNSESNPDSTVISPKSEQSEFNQSE